MKKKIKDFSQVIGLIERGGTFGASNEESEKKIQDLFMRYDMMPNAFFTRDQMPLFQTMAKDNGFKVMIVRRGLNR